MDKISEIKMEDYEIIITILDLDLETTDNIYIKNLQITSKKLIEAIWATSLSTTNILKSDAGRLGKIALKKLDSRVADKITKWLVEAKELTIGSINDENYKFILAKSFYELCIKYIKIESVNPTQIEIKIIEIEKKEKEVNYKKIFRNEFFEYCNIEAIYDLLTGNLQNLDAAINDAGCQWRVPFVLDLYNDLTEYLLQKFSQKKILKALQIFEEIREFTTSKGEGCSIYKNYKEWTVHIVKTKPKKATMQNEYWKLQAQNLNQYIEKITEKPLDCDFITFSDILKEAKIFLNSWKSDVLKPYTAQDYLICCKIYTIRHVRGLDIFGLAAVPEDLDVFIFEKYRLKVVTTIADCSSKYMLYVTKFCCEQENIIFDNENNILENKNENKNQLSLSIFNQCKKLVKTRQLETIFNTHVFYGPFRSILSYQCHRNQPIIIDLRRLLCRTVENKNYYQFNGGAILYYVPINGIYTLVENPDENQINSVAMCIEAFSILQVDENGDYAGNIEYSKKEQGFFSKDFGFYLETVKTCSIVNLILTSGSLHGELPSNIFDEDEGMHEKHDSKCDEIINGIYSSSMNVTGQSDRYLQNLTDDQVPLINITTDIWDVVTEKQQGCLLMKNFGITNAAYRSFVTIEKKRRGVRICNTIPFAPIHIYGCTYAIRLLDLKKTLLLLKDKEDHWEGQII